MFASWRWIVLVLVAASFPLHVAGSQNADDARAAEIERSAGDIFNQVMSPFCPGLLLANCPSGQAVQLRAEIREKLGAGVSADSIMEEIYATYGDEYRGAPQAKGMGLLAWVIPGFFILLGGSWLAWWTKRNARQTRHGDHHDDDVEVDEETRAMLDAELSKS